MNERLPTELEAAVDRVLIETFNRHVPGLRREIRALLQKGVPAAELRKRHGIKINRRGLTACAIDAMVAEWEREREEKTGPAPGP